MIKVSEYLSLGLPAIVADLPENRATAGDAAAYFRAGDADDLAERLTEVLFDPRRREEMAAAARDALPRCSGRTASPGCWPRIATSSTGDRRSTATNTSPTPWSRQEVDMDALPFLDLPRDTLPFLDLPRLHASIRARLDEAFDRVVRTGAFIEGSRTGEVRAGVRRGPRPRGCSRGRLRDRRPGPRAAGPRRRSRRRGRGAVDDVHRHRRGSRPRRRHARDRRRRRRHVAAHSGHGGAGALPADQGGDPGPPVRPRGRARRT